MDGWEGRGGKKGGSEGNGVVWGDGAGDGRRWLQLRHVASFGSTWWLEAVREEAQKGYHTYVLGTSYR
jgi:hypothetical protein